MLDRPEGVPAEAVPGDRLLERVLVGDQLAVVGPGTRHGDLVEQRELHDVAPPEAVHPGTARADMLSLSARLARAQPIRDRGWRCHAWAGGTDLHRHRGRLGHRAGQRGAAAGRGVPASWEPTSPSPTARCRLGARRGRPLGLRPYRRHRRSVRWPRWCRRPSPSAGRSTGWSTRPAWPAADRCTCSRPAEWARVIAVNLTGTFLTAKHVIAQLLGQPARADGQRGSVVTIASIEGLEGTAGGSAYSASKGGVVILTKNMAIDYAGRGIRVNADLPGFIDTPMSASIFGPGHGGGAGRHPARAQAGPAHGPARRDRLGGGLLALRRRVVRDRARPPGRRRATRPDGTTG